MTYLRRVEFVMEVGPDTMGGLEVMRRLKDAGIEYQAFGQCRVCDACKGRAYLDAGPMVEGNDCIRQSKKCTDCDERGKLLDVAAS